MYLIEIQNGKSFRANAGETLLSAALRANVSLAYSCRSGRCSTCKCKVLNGQTKASHDELGLSQQDRDEGWVLSCVREPLTDVTMNADDLGDLDLPEPRTLACRIQSLQLLTPDVMKVVLRLPPKSDFRCHAGQYIEVMGEGGVRRSYSIANAMTDTQQLELHIRHVPGGVMSHFWFEKATQNDLLRLNGPLGTFVVRQVTGNDLVFLATGTGIAPVKAMLESLHMRMAEHMPRSVTVYWGGRVASDLYWQPPPEYAWVQFKPVLSREPAFAGRQGYVQQAFLSEHSDLAHTVVYACGSPEMIAAAKQALQSAGLPDNSFYADAFVSSGVE